MSSRQFVVEESPGKDVCNWQIDIEAYENLPHF